MERVFQVQLEPLGVSFAAPESVTLLEAARVGGVVLPVSCRNGTCRTCMCRVTEGSVRYVIAWPGLSREEKLEGYVLACVAYAESDLVVEAGAARLR